jgi:large conductance mechanosensitive channel
MRRIAIRGAPGILAPSGPGQREDSMLKEFREFALKGNMVDLAIGVIIGAAFGGLVQSVVNDLLMPIIGFFTGGIDFSQMYVQLKGAAQPTLAEAKTAGPTIAYGNFITLLINFLIVAWVLFLVVKMMNRLKRQPPPPTPEPVKLTRQEELLVEIRDALKTRA